MVVSPAEKILQALRLITHVLSQGLTKSILYFPTCAMVDYFYPLLSNLPLLQQFKIISLHGQLPPSARQKNFAHFCSIESPCVLLTTDVAARGLDVPNVDLVVQLDPPMDPKNFAHRCGRAGRAGRPGKAVVLLTKGREEEYVELLKVRGMPLRPVHRIFSEGNALEGEDKEGVEELVEQFRGFMMSDRAYHDKVPISRIELTKAMKAFPSYVQAYSKHQASFIFRINELDIPAIAYSWGLLKLPRMPELKGREISWNEPNIDVYEL
jgi:ATP-dependent RNA helicase DDX55/SPB4